MKPTAIAAVLVIVFVLLIGAVAWAMLQKPTPPGPEGVVRTYVGVSLANVSWKRVTMTFDLVEVHEATGNNSTGWRTLTLPDGAAPLDLTKLNNTTTALIGTKSIPVGNYTSVRLRVSNVVGTLVNGTVVFMDVVGNLTVDQPFRVNASLTTDVTVFIDLQASIVPSGLTWYFHPVAGSSRAGVPG